MSGFRRCGLLHPLNADTEVMGLQPSDGKWSRRLLRADSRAACGQIPISGIPKRLYYCVILQYVHNLHVAAGRGLDTRALR